MANARVVDDDFLGAFSSVAELERRYPAAQRSGVQASVTTGSADTPYVSDGVSWKALSSFSTDSQGNVTGLVGYDFGNRADFVAALLSSAALGGGRVGVQSRAVIPSTANIQIPTGNGVNVEGNGAIFDFSAATGTFSAFTLVSLNTTFPIAGQDTNASPFWGWRGGLNRVGMIGPGAASTVDGLSADGAANPVSRAARALVYGVVVKEFRYGITLRNVSYMENFQNIHSLNCNAALSIEGGSDQGENTLFNHCVLSDSNVGVLVQAGTDNVEVVLNQTSVDYNKQHIVWSTGYGDLTFHDPHFETSAARASVTTAYPIDLSAGSTVPSRLTLDGGFHVCAGGPNPVWPAYMIIGNNMTVHMRGNARLQTLGNSSGGYAWGIGKGLASADVPISALCKVTSGGDFVLDDPIQCLTVSQLPSITAPTASNSLLKDPGFEQSIVIDNWWDATLLSGGGATIGTLTTGTTDFLTGSRCLIVPLIGGAGTNRTLRCNISVDKLKRGGGKMFRMGWWLGMKLSAGSGNAFITWRSVIGGYYTPTTWVTAKAYAVGDLVTNAGINYYCVTAHTSGTFATDLAANRWSITHTLAGTGTAWTQTVTGANITSDTTAAQQTYWTPWGINGAQDRITVPETATHIQLELNLGSVNNAGGNLYIDDVYVTPW